MERTQQSSVSWIPPSRVLSICRGPGFSEFSCIQRIIVQQSKSKDTRNMCMFLTKIKDMQPSQTKANRRDSATVRVRVRSTCRCVQRPHTLSTILQRCSNRMCRDSNLDYCCEVSLYNKWVSEWSWDPEAISVQNCPGLALLQLRTQTLPPYGFYSSTSHLLGGLKHGLRPLPTAVSVASPNVLPATAGIKYSMLDSEGALRAICKSKAHSWDSRGPGTSPDSLLSQIK